MVGFSAQNKNPLFQIVVANSNNFAANFLFTIQHKPYSINAQCNQTTMWVVFATHVKKRSTFRVTFALAIEILNLKHEVSDRKSAWQQCCQSKQRCY